jgi:hypothetical protein
MAPLVHQDLAADDVGDDLDDAAIRERLRRSRLDPKIRALEDAVAQAISDGDGPLLVKRAQLLLNEALEAEALKHKAIREAQRAESAKAAGARKVKADAPEKKIRAHGPFCEFHAGGRAIRIELQNPEQVVRSFAVEAIRGERGCLDGVPDRACTNASRLKG